MRPAIPIFTKLLLSSYPPCSRIRVAGFGPTVIARRTDMAHPSAVPNHAVSAANEIDRH